MDIAINYFEVLVAAVIAVVLGTLWYGPLFGKTWMRLGNIAKPDVITPEIKKQMNISYSIQFVGALIQAFAFMVVYVALVPHFAALGGLAPLKVAGVVWLIVAVAQVPMVLWEGRPWKYYWIVTGYSLVYLILLSILFTLWT